MKKRRKQKNSYKSFVIFIMLIFLSLFFYYSNQKTFSFASNLKNITSNITSKITTPFENLFSSFKNRTRFNNLNYENKKLEQEIKDLKIKEEIIISLENEITELKSLLNLKNNSKEEMVFAKVTLRNPEFWNKTIVIDKGSKDNIKKGDAIITEHGLIGMITQISKNSATVSLITDYIKENQISVQIKKDKKTYQGIIKKYQDGIFEVEGLTNYDGVKVGDSIYTTGLGNFPSDLFVGIVTKVKSDQYGLSKILEVTPKQDMDKIKYVAVLVRK